MTTERRAVDGELCTCGRTAVTVFITEKFGETGWCGRSDGGSKARCVFCNGTEQHEPGGRCPRYRLRLDTGEASA
ncbi:hypothetical protein [Nocardia sp. CA-120079]|uniref:hypothetical protein n=1 Tax=Nocardia sp. CA-120079 TaxID=3239974 RepID=UPI003D97AB37